MYGVRFLQTHLFLFYERAQLAPDELRQSGHHPATVRLAGRKRHASFFESSVL